MKNRATFIVLAWALCPALFAQSPAPAAAPAVGTVVLTLPEAIQKTLRFSPALSAADQDILAAKAKHQESKAASIVPEFNLRVFGGPTTDVPQGSGPENNFPRIEETDFSDIGPFIRTQIELLQPIYTFGKISNLQKAAGHNVAAKELQKVSARNELIFQVKKAYYGLAFLYSLDDFLRELDDRSKKAKDRIEERIKSGSGEATDIDLMRMEVFRSDTEKRLIELQYGILFARQTLALLTGLAPKEVDIVDKYITVKKIELQPLDHYLARAKVARPEMSQLNEGVGAAQSYMKSVRAEFFPSFFLLGFYNFARAPGREDIESPFLVDNFNFDSMGGTLGMEQKLSFHRTSAKFKEARAQFAKAKALRDLAYQGMEIEIRKAYNDFAGDQSSYEAAEKAFKVGRSWVLATTLNFGAGLVPIKDLLEAFVAYSRVKFSYLDAMQEFNTSLAQLSKTIGEEVSDVRY